MRCLHTPVKGVSEVGVKECCFRYAWGKNTKSKMTQMTPYHGESPLHLYLLRNFFLKWEIYRRYSPEIRKQWEKFYTTNSFGMVWSTTFSGFDLIRKITASEWTSADYFCPPLYQRESIIITHQVIHFYQYYFFSKVRLCLPALKPNLQTNPLVFSKICIVCLWKHHHPLFNLLKFRKD